MIVNAICPSDPMIPPSPSPGLYDHAPSSSTGQFVDWSPFEHQQLLNSGMVPKNSATMLSDAEVMQQPKKGGGFILPNGVQRSRSATPAYILSKNVPNDTAQVLETDVQPPRQGHPQAKNTLPSYQSGMHHDPLLSQTFTAINKERGLCRGDAKAGGPLVAPSDLSRSYAGNELRMNKSTPGFLMPQLSSSSRRATGMPQTPSKHSCLESEDMSVSDMNPSASKHHWRQFYCFLKFMLSSFFHSS